MVDGADVPVAPTGVDVGADLNAPAGSAAPSPADPEALLGDAPIPLAPEDLTILELEGPTIAGHACKVLRVGPNPPDVAELRARIAERIHLAPALTRRLGSDATGAPAWLVNPDFDVDQHVVAHRHDEP